MRGEAAWVCCASFRVGSGVWGGGSFRLARNEIPWLAFNIYTEWNSLTLFAIRLRKSKLCVLTCQNGRRVIIYDGSFQKCWDLASGGGAVGETITSWSTRHILPAVRWGTSWDVKILNRFTIAQYQDRKVPSRKTAFWKTMKSKVWFPVYSKYTEAWFNQQMFVNDINM